MQSKKKPAETLTRLQRFSPPSAKLGRIYTDKSHAALLRIAEKTQRRDSDVGADLVSLKSGTMRWHIIVRCGKRNVAFCLVVL